MQIGDTFYWKDGGHLWVVICDPEPTSGEVIAVNITRDVFRAGRECELTVGDHKWIKEKSYVSFGDAMKLGPKEMLNLEKQIAGGAIGKHFPMKASVLQRIISAAKASKAFAPDLAQYL